MQSVAENMTKSDDLPLATVLENCVELCGTLSQRIPNIFVTLGKHGLVLARRADISLRFPTKRFPSVNTFVSIALYGLYDARIFNMRYTLTVIFDINIMCSSYVTYFSISLSFRSFQCLKWVERKRIGA